MKYSEKYPHERGMGLFAILAEDESQANDALQPVGEGKWNEGDGRRTARRGTGIRPTPSNRRSHQGRR